MASKVTSAPFRYVNRKGDAFYPRRVPAGKRPARWTMSHSAAGAADAVPEGHEIVETPNGQVSIRAVKPRVIIPAEEALAKERLATLGLADYRVEVKNRDVIIHAPDGPDDASLGYMMNPLGIPLEEWMAVWPDRPKRKAAAKAILEETRRQMEAEKARLREKMTQYAPVLRFHLSDVDARLFIVSRMCFRGGMPHWLELEDMPLADGCDRYFPHLGRESFYELNYGGLA